MTVFDYDKLKNYRFLLFDNEIKILDSKMKNVKGFIKKNIIGIQKNNPKHFRIGKKDYLIFNSNNKLKITDRRGNIRIKNKLIDNISLTDIDQKLIYLFDSKSNLVPNFPVFGSSKIDLFEDKNSRKYITSIGESDEILVYSLY